MLPTLKPSQKIICFNWSYLFSNPKAGDLVIAKVQDRELVKRVTRVENNRFFLEGDNKEKSTDSKKFGFLGKESILGKIIWF